MKSKESTHYLASPNCILDLNLGMRLVRFLVSSCCFSVQPQGKIASQSMALIPPNHRKLRLAGAFRLECPTFLPSGRNIQDCQNFMVDYRFRKAGIRWPMPPSGVRAKFNNLDSLIPS